MQLGARNGHFDHCSRRWDIWRMNRGALMTGETLPKIVTKEAVQAISQWSNDILEKHAANVPQIHARMRSNLMSALVHLLPEAECDAIVLGITALVDGLWLRLGLQSTGLAREDALRQMHDYLSHRLPSTTP